MKVMRVTGRIFYVPLGFDIKPILIVHNYANMNELFVKELSKLIKLTAFIA